MLCKNYCITIINYKLKIQTTEQKAPQQEGNKNMEHEKITSKDKLIYAITLASIFFGVLGLGMLGVVVNIFG